MSECCYAVVRNIPKQFHSSDLRSFFSQVIEENLFRCFHYKHRPEILQNAENGSKIHKSCSCVVSFVLDQHRNKFIEKYHNHNWTDKSEKVLKEKCFILRITIDKSNNLLTSPYYTKAELKRRKRHTMSETFTNEDILKLSELNPPINVMPKGNVGTPIPTFLKLIRDCKLPPKLIKSLGLVFPETNSKNIYGNVQFNYRGQVQANSYNDEDLNPPDLDQDNVKMDQGDEDSSSDDDRGEEWDRHNALNNDTTSQERCKERLFEEEIELKWEKGGSGLVFYTDAQYWADQDGDFDEQTTDDWDVDYSGYYGEEGDRDNRDFINIMKEKRLRNGQRIPKHKYMQKNKQDFGGFEEHTTGIGSKLLNRMGWEKGKAIGNGIIDPVELQGQNSKKGLGFHGDKLQKDDMINHTEHYEPSNKVLKKNIYKNEDFLTNRSVEPLASHSWIFPQFRSNLTSVLSQHKPLRPEERQKLIPGEDGIVISTIYDEKLDVDLDSGLLRSQFSTALKHREKTTKNIKKFSDKQTYKDINKTHLNSDNADPNKGVKIDKNSKEINKNFPKNSNSIKVKTGSKLVNPEQYKKHFNEHNLDENVLDKNNQSYSGLHSMSIQFVRPSNKKDYIT